MLIPDMMAGEAAQAFTTFSKLKFFTRQVLADRTGYVVGVAEKIESSDLDTCLALREKNLDLASIERRLCDAMYRVPASCRNVDDGVIF